MATKKVYAGVLIILITFGFLSCGQTTVVTDPFICNQTFSETMNEVIPILTLESTSSVVDGDTDRFICPIETTDGINISNSVIKTHKIIFAFDASYPVQSIQIGTASTDNAINIPKVSIDISLNGYSYTRILTDVTLTNGDNLIDLENQNAKYVRFVFPANEEITYHLSNINFILGSGYIVKEDPLWNQAFFRTSVWTGGDGIFSFDLKGNNEWAKNDDNIAFIFSDTFTSSVRPDTTYRINNTMINNSIAYFDGVKNPSDGLSFVYDTDSNDLPISPFIPDSFIGYAERNLIDGDGLSVYPSEKGLLNNQAPGYMWRSTEVLNNALTIDLGSVESLGDIYLWNENSTPSIGVKTFRIDTSIDGITYINGNVYEMNQASGLESEPFTLHCNLNNIDARYLRLTILSGYDDNLIGLGKILIKDEFGKALFGQIEAVDTLQEITGNETSSRLWLQDAIVIDDFVYLFPLLVKDESTAFYVASVNSIKAPIVDGLIDYKNATYLSSPLYIKTLSGGDLYFGAGILDNRDIDGYIYIYGYLDLDGRKLTVARTTAENISNFNEWLFYNGTSFSDNPLDSAPFLDSVSPELSVTYMTSGIYQGKYMLVAMEGTTSGRVSYSVGESPVGPFSEFHLLYETSESEYLKSAFTYNAKMHPILSTPEAFLISYNVNTTSISALGNTEIYYPRFIIVTEVKAPKGE